MLNKKYKPIMPFLIATAKHQAEQSNKSRVVLEAEGAIIICDLQTWDMDYQPASILCLIDGNGKQLIPSTFEETGDL